MTDESAVPERTPTVEEMREEVLTLRRQVAALGKEKADLELLLEMTNEHSDSVEEELHSRAKHALRESEQRLRLIVEATPIPIVISHRSDGVIVYANRMTGPLLGLPTESLSGRKIADFYTHPGDEQWMLAELARQGEIDHHEVQLNTASGRKVWVDASLRDLVLNNEPSVLSAWHDITHLKEMNQASLRFVPQEYLSFLEKQSITDIHLGDHISDEMTVMFSDIRGFTTLAESMTPKENFDFVNGYLGRVSPMVREHGGFIVKYMGDGVMAVFPRRADDAVQAGIAKLRRVQEYNQHRQASGRAPIQIGIGVNTGYIMVGVIGELGRMQSDALSDAVNLSARLEGLTKFYGVSFIIADVTYNRLVAPDRYSIRFLDRVQVKGKTRSLNLYEVFDADPPAQRLLKRETREEFEGALRLYYAQDFEAAQTKLFSVLQRNPKDKVAWHHLVQATRLAEQGTIAGWTGVTVMNEK